VPMKRVIINIVVVVLALAGALTGCLSESPPAPAPEPAPAPAPPPAPPVNHPPDTPIISSGSASGQTGVSHTYFTSSTDADGDEVKYVFNWDDGSTSETGFSAAGARGSESHAWSSPGTYFIRVRAIDNNGALSGWSEPWQVTITAPTYTLTTAVDPDGSGFITPGEGSFEAGTPVVLTAEPASGYVFDHWGGDAAGTSVSIECTMESDKHIVAYFTPPPKTGPVLEWSKTFGGEAADGARSVQQTADGGYVIGGSTRSFGSGLSDVYLIQTDAGGNKLWEQNYGGDKIDNGFSVQITVDGGYIIAGETQSYGFGSSDVWLLKIDPSGQKTWSQTFGGGIPEWGWSVQQTADKGYIISGSVVASAGPEIWLIKTDSFGRQLWYQTFDGDSDKAVSAVQQTSDGGYIIVSDARSYKTGIDIWLIKTDANGDKIWERTFGGEGYDYAHSVQQTSDGGYIISGETKSYGAGNADVWLIKTDGAGYIVWDKTYGGEQRDSGLSVQQTSDGGYIISGETESYGAGDADVWLIKTDSAGNKVWDKTYGGGQRDSGLSVRQTADGGYIISGETESYGAGSVDVWLLKVSAD